MMKFLSTALLLLGLLGVSALQAGEGNPNVAVPGQGATVTASSEDRDHQVKRLYDGRLTHRWETEGETKGAWAEVRWDKPQTLEELWIVNQPTPFDLLLEPESRSADFPAAKLVRIDFSDGTSQQAELRLGTYYQIITLPKAKTTDRLRVTLLDMWDNSSADYTGLGKLQAYGRAHAPAFRVDVYAMYDMQGDKPVQSAKIEITNPGEAIRGAGLQILCDGKPYAELKLADIPARSVSVQQLWMPAPFEAGEMTFSIRRSGAVRFTETQTLAVKPYDKNYFDGGKFRILSTNHNDLGFLDTQFVTADYRSRELIGPALDLLRENPEYTYFMESIEYLKEFLERYPQRRDEIAARMREGRFQFGASYIQNLQAHVGAEKLARQFYYGRRWLRENFPGCDTRFYCNTDVPGLTFQLPQVLRQAGIDYIVQGRFPWGYYYWEGLDGTSIPVFALRYTASRQLLNPVDNTGWLPFQNIREPYYRERNLPKEVIYDFSCDYLPPAPEMIPYVKKQNEAMKRFAGVWNDHFKGDTSRRITPPVLEFSTPERALNDMFGRGTLDVETVRGDWPMSWAYFDEPGHRDGLLAGRKGHNTLLQAERINAWLTALDPQAKYPHRELEAGWLANCWPDHGWGGNRGIVTDSINEAFYRRSLEVASTLCAQAGDALAARFGGVSAGAVAGDAQRLPLMVYNPAGWERTDLVSGSLTYPASWTGLVIRDAEGNEIPYEITAHDAAARRIDLLFRAAGIPSLGYKVYYAGAAASFAGEPRPIEADSLETDLLKVRFSQAGLASVYDKTTAREVLRTDKFAGGEVVQFTAPGVAWNEYSEVTTANFDRTARHGLKTVQATESPVRYVVEKEATFPDFTLRQRYILNKGAREVVVETDLLDWKGVKDRELRVLFPMNLGKEARMSYEVPFGTVELNRDEIDYSNLPETTECQFVGAYYGRDLPFREAVNWVDASSGLYRGGGCLLASDMTLHLFKDESDDPVDYPVVQHVLLSSRKSLAWNPENWFVQPGDHHYRMALYPHEGNWRMAYREGMAFNMPLTLYTAPAAAGQAEGGMPVSQSFLEAAPANMIFSAVKQAEDGDGLFVRLYEAEGRHTTLRLKGFKPFSRVQLTDLIEYNEKELPVEADGTLRLEVKPWEIVNLRINW